MCFQRYKAYPDSAEKVKSGYPKFQLNDPICPAPFFQNVHLRWSLSSQKIASAITAFSKRKFKIAILTASSAEKLQKNRGMRSQIAAFRHRKFQIACFLPVEQQRQVEGAQMFSK